MAWFEHGEQRVYYEEAGEGEPVLLFPGFSEGIGLHRDLRTVLAKRYRVFAADLPGSGQSQPQPRRYHPGYYDDDARLFAAFVRTVTGAPVRLMGFSDGGEVALLLAALFPDLARSVVSWGAAGAGRDPDGSIALLFHDIIDHPAPDTESYRSYLVSTYGEDNARAMTQSFSEAIGAIIRNGGDISASKAGQITCPVLLMAGEDDMFVPEVLLDEFVAASKTTTAIRVPGAGHDVHNARKEWFLQTVTDWLAAH